MKPIKINHDKLSYELKDNPTKTDILEYLIYTHADIEAIELNYIFDCIVHISENEATTFAEQFTDEETEVGEIIELLLNLNNKYSTYIDEEYGWLNSNTDDTPFEKIKSKVSRD